MPVPHPRPDTSCAHIASPTREDSSCPNRQHDTDALMTDILERHFDELNRFALSLCGRQDLAADLVQQACLKAWAARQSYDSSLPSRPWLFRILKNEFLQIVRRPTPFTNVEDAMFEKDPAGSRSDCCATDTLALWQSLSMLPDLQRHAVTLVVAMGFSYEEAAEICDCSTGTIKSRVNRGRRRMQQALGNPEYAAPADCSAQFSSGVAALPDR